MPIDIVVEAMGSDKAPEPEVRGAVLACRQLDVRVHLAGPEHIIRPVLRQALRGQHLPVFVLPASEWITMDDKAAQAVRTKRDSSMRVGLRLVREGRDDLRNELASSLTNLGSALGQQRFAASG